jgi:hypothetical protein
MFSRRWTELSCVSLRDQHNEERRNSVQVEDKPSQRDHELEACHSYGVHGYMKIF